MVRIAVMGSGSWGTTVAKVCADAAARPATHRMPTTRCHPVGPTRGARRGDPRAAHQLVYLPDVILPETITATSDAAEALAGADVVFLGVPSQSLRSTWPAGAT